MSSTSDTCSDCAPESSASESAMPSSVVPSSSESPSNQISSSRLNVSQENVSATSVSTPSISTSVAVVATSPPVCNYSVNVTPTITVLLNLHLPHLFLLLIL